MSTYQIQCLLGYLRYDHGAIDGIDGPKTQAALSKFHSDYGMGAEGLVGAVAGTVSKLEKVPELESSTFWDDIKYFRREEYRCRCGRFCDGFPVEPSEKLVRLQEQVREHFGRPVNNTSGVRCPQHNANVGGVANSRHLSGKAVDFAVDGYSAAKVLSFVQSLPGVRYAYAIDSGHVHMDVE